MAAKRPGALTAICILGIILGCLSACATCWSAAGAAMSASMQGQLDELRRQTAQPGGDPGMDEMTRMQDELMALQQEQMPILLGLSGLGMLIGIVILGAASVTLAGRAAGPKVMGIACALAIPWELGRGTVEGWLQWRNHQFMQSYMDRILNLGAAQGNAPPPEMAQMETWMSGFMGASAAAGICFAVGWMLLKIVYYGISVAYFRKAEVRALFPTQTEVRGREA